MRMFMSVGLLDIIFLQILNFALSNRNFQFFIRVIRNYSSTHNFLYNCSVSAPQHHRPPTFNPYSCPPFLIKWLDGNLQ